MERKSQADWGVVPAANWAIGARLGAGVGGGGGRLSAQRTSQKVGGEEDSMVRSDRIKIEG